MDKNTQLSVAIEIIKKKFNILYFIVVHGNWSFIKEISIYKAIHIKNNF